MNKRLASAILAGLISISSNGAIIAEADSGEKNDSVQQNQETEYYYDIAKNYFGIEDPYKIYEYSPGTTKVFFANIDNERRKILVKYPGGIGGVYYDFFTKEKIHVDGERFKNSFKYFDEGVDVSAIDRSSFGEIYPGEGFDDYVDYSAIDIVKAMMAIDPELKNWYVRKKVLSLSDFQYKNIVPSINDDKLIEKHYFQMLLRLDLSASNVDKILFVNTENFSQETNIINDLFWGTEIEVYKKDTGIKVNDKYTKDYIDGRKNSVAMLFNEDIFQISLNEYTKPLRDCIEVKDGVEYYNVGKLRKLYENLPQENRYDYSIKPFNQPASADPEMDSGGSESHAGLELAAGGEEEQIQPANADTVSNSNLSEAYAELTIGSSGQDVLSMKQRFFELGYFRTNQFSDQFNNNTADTVKQFEKNNGLKVDGVADAVMLGVLFSDSAVGK